MSSPCSVPLFLKDTTGAAPMFQTPQAMFCSCHFQFRHTPYTALGTPPAPSHPHPPVVTRACPVAYNLRRSSTCTMENTLEHGLLRPLIADSYTPKTLSMVRKTLESRRTHEILPIAHGLFAASPGQSPDSATGYQNVWVRDNVMVAYSLLLRGDTASAASCIRGITQFFKKQLPRFREIIDDPVRVLKEDANRRPHIRFTAQNLGELPEKWPHAQNDALGHALWFRFQLANVGALPLTPEDYEVYSVFPDYFDAIEYWQDRDSGAWEEGRKINNSSVGAAIAGLEEMLKHHLSSKRRGKASSVKATCLDRLRYLAAKGRERLAATLPFEAPPERLVDSALLFLIY